MFAIRASRTSWSTALLVIAVTAPAANAATIQQITNFGPNPTGIGMYLYTPTNVVARPPILVGPHACHGRGTDVCSAGAPFAAQADRYGFLLVCPSAVSSDGCWDVHSTADLTHNGGGDAVGIISMVNYVVQNHNGDATRVFSAGHSSGGMMTNVLLGSYPDVFKAGAAYAGVAFGCFASGPVDSLGWNAACANGNVTKTGAEWAALVRAAFPGFAGTRPRIQLWHGTVDAIVNFHNFGEEIKEWTNVLGVSETPTSTENNAVQSTWIRTRYADSAGVVQIEAIQETGQPHNLVVNAAEAIRFFGLDGSNPTVDGGTPDASGAGPGRDAAAGDASGRVDVGSTGSIGGAGGAAAGSGGVSATGGAGGTTGVGAPHTGGVTGGGTPGPQTNGPDAGPGTTGGGAANGAPPGKGATGGCSVVGASLGDLMPEYLLLLLLAVFLVAARSARRPGIAPRPW